MIRTLADDLLLVLLPFALFFAYLVIRRRNPMLRESWSGQVGWLSIAGVGLVVAAFLLAGIFAERRTGAFVPTHVENGRVVPGQFR